MTETNVRSRNGLLKGKIPLGWFSATGDSLGAAVTLLLISDAAEATLSIKEIKLDLRSVRQIAEEGLALLARISAAARAEQTGVIASEPQEFKLQEKRFCSYELTEGSTRTRTVVFSSGGMYYECEVRGKNRNWTGEEYARIFTAQQTFLSSLTN